MSHFLKSPDTRLPPRNLLFAAADYMLDELLQSVHTTKLQNSEGYKQGDGEKLIQDMIDNSNHKLRMYGTAKEFIENINIYTNFPGSHKIFKTEAGDLYHTTPIIYNSLKDEKYICKPDLFIILQNMALHYLPEPRSRVQNLMIAIFLKSQEERVSGKLEFVPYNSTVLEEIEKEIQGMAICFISKTEELDNRAIKMSNYNLDDYLKKFKELIPKVWTESESSALRKLLEHFYEGRPNDRLEVMTLLYFLTNTIIKCLQSVINKRPEMFLPYSETKNNKTPITVRLFEDGQQKFVMKAELFQAINKVSPGSDQISYADDECFIYTIEMEEVLQKYKNRIENIEFIRTPILRAKHRAVPIKGLNTGEYCVLAVDAMFHLLKNMIFGVKMFQKTMKKIWKDALFLFKKMELLFNPETKCIHFFKLESFSNLVQMFDQGMKVMELLPAKDVRNAKKDGFTVENLKNELKHLGLTNLFDEIADYAEVVYEEVMRVKKEEYLRTCDLFDAIEHCQLICIFNRVPNLRKFLHNQKSCGRVLTLKCDSCIGKLTDPSPRAMIPGKEANKIEEEVSAVNQMTKTLKPNTVSQKNETNKITETSSVIQEAKSSKTDEKPPVIQDDKLSKPSSSSQKQSKSCDKCFRTSEMHNETKKELKTSQNKMKKLEKKISENEKNMKEEKSKYEKIIQEKKKEMEEKMKEIENLKKEIADHTEIVTDNEEMTLKILSMKMKETHKKEENIKKEQTFLEKQTEMSEIISQLREQLNSENQKTQLLEQEILELQEKVQTEKEDIWITEKCEFEQKLQEKTRQINEFHESNIRLKAENEVNGRMIQQLMDKLTKATVNTPTDQSTHQLHPYYQNVSIHPMQIGYAPGAYSLPSTSSLITNSSFVEESKCLICPIALKPTDSMIKCQKCKRRLHSNCASNWLKISKKCPECNEDLLAPSKLRPF